ncbi:MAG: hypothetical protein WBW74_04910 [Xanthobacteraceae bacterium]
MHEFKPDRAIGATFIALPGAAFTVGGPRAASDAARIDAGAKLAIGPNAWVFASFDGEFSDRSQSYAGKGGGSLVRRKPGETCRRLRPNPAACLRASVHPRCDRPAIVRRAPRPAPVAEAARSAASGRHGWRDRPD